VDLKGFHFLHPSWLAALPLLWLLTAWLARGDRLDGKWSQVVDADLLPALRLGGSHRGSSPWWLIGALWTLAALALSGMTWQREQSAAFRAPVDWVLVLDLSPSMATADVAPNRYTRARYAISDILEAARDARVGLVVFAGEAHIVAPLTTDVATVRALLPPLSPGIMPETGDALAPALDEVSSLMGSVTSRHPQVVVLTDGVADTAEAMQRVERLRADGATVNIVGVGTTSGAPEPGRDGSFIHDAQGQPVVSKLPREALQRIAAAGGGQYVSVSDTQRLVAHLQAVRALQSSSYEENTDRRVTQWRNDGVYLLIPLVLLTPLVARRGWV
jgi:Ca-activated chloride channel family protein